MNNGSTELSLTQYNLSGGGSGTNVVLANKLTVIDNAIEIDFGTGVSAAIAGNRRR